jgi:hypothetical protein
MICNTRIRQRREWPGASAERWLSLAAAPTFAIMALFTAMAGGGASDILCSASASPFGGMIPMYLLMSAFHSAPWLRLITRAFSSEVGTRQNKS